MLTKDKIEFIKAIALAVIVLAICGTVLLWPKIRKPEQTPGRVLVEQSFIDSLRMVAEMPPDTVFQVKIVIKDTTIYIIKNNPTPYYIDLPTNRTSPAS